MTRRRPLALLAAALLTAGCGDTLASMTQHWFYGYVTDVGTSELCLDDSRAEDLEAERCFRLDGAEPGDVAAGDLVKVRYERDAEAGHGGGTAIEIVSVRKTARSDG